MGFIKCLEMKALIWAGSFWAVDFPQLWRAEAAPRCGAQALTAVAPLLAEHRL